MPGQHRLDGGQQPGSELAVEFGEHIEALDVNPLICELDGAIAVGARAVPRRTTPPVS